MQVQQAHQAMTIAREPRFYVYALKDARGLVLYVGKGSGRRLDSQRSRFQCDGVVLRRFASEKKAYEYERRMIAQLMPELNRHPGGGGGTAQRIKPRRRYDWEIEMDRIGTRVYAARALLKFDYPFEPSMRASLERVAGGDLSLQN